MKKVLIAGVLLAAAGGALAKLPPPSEDAKAKAAEAAAKAAWTAKVEGYLLCKAQDQTVAQYFKTARASGKDPKPGVSSAACADPGPFVYTPPETKLPEASPAAGQPPGPLPAAAAAAAKKS